MAKRSKPTSLSTRAMLVSLNISAWTGNKRDAEESEQLSIKHGAKNRAARAHKSLLPDCRELVELHKYTGTIRTWFYKQTLPWADGMQIIQVDNYMNFMSEFRTHRDRWETLAQKFMDVYPDAVRDAGNPHTSSLGTLFKAADYPDVQSLAAKFSIDLKYLPVPEAADWRVDLGEEDMGLLRREIEEQVKSSTQEAMGVAWKRLFEVAKHAHEKLSNPGAVFRDTLVHNAAEVCAALRSLNLTGDATLEKMRREVEVGLCKFNPGTLRKDPLIRADAAAKMAAAMSKMSGYVG